MIDLWITIGNAVHKLRARVAQHSSRSAEDRQSGNTMFDVPHPTIVLRDSIDAVASEDRMAAAYPPSQIRIETRVGP